MQVVNGMNKLTLDILVGVHSSKYLIVSSQPRQVGSQ